MGLKSDRWIIAAARMVGMIEPFEPSKVRNGVISYGVSSYGYDIRVADEFKVFVAMPNMVIDPKHFSPSCLVDVIAVDGPSGRYVDIPPHSFALARTVEFFRIPSNVLTTCLNKSSYARCGLILNVTPFEPGWRGYATLEMTNPTPLPIRVYAGEGIGQLLFFEGDEACAMDYQASGGTYQDQPAQVVVPRVGRG